MQRTGRSSPGIVIQLFFILLVVTRALGEVAERLHQPGLVGELLAGILLGTLAVHYSHLLPRIGDLNDNAVFESVTDLGMFFIMLFAGLELHPSRLIAQSRGAFVVAVSGMALPVALALGLGLGWVFLPRTDVFVSQCVFLGTALAVTAVPATVRILMDLGQLESRSGQIIVSAAVFDDVLSLVLLGWLTGLIDPDSGGVALVPLALMALGFFAAATLIGVFEAQPGSDPIVAHLFSAVVIVAVLTTLVMPVVLKRIYQKDRAGLGSG